MYKGMGYLNSLAFSPDGEKVAADLSDCGDFKIWKTGNGQFLAAYPQRKEPFEGFQQLVFSPGGRLLVFKPFISSAKLWDVVTDKEVVKFSPDLVRGHTKFVNGFRIGWTDGKAMVWNLSTGKLVWGFSMAGNFQFHPACTPDARIIAGLVTVGRDFGPPTKFKIIRAGGKEENFPPGDAHDRSSYPALSPDGREVAVITPKEMEQLPPPLSWFLSSEGNGPTHQAKILEIPGGRLLGTIGRARQVKYSPDGQMLAVEGDDGVVRLYDYPLRRPWGTILAWAGLVAVGSLLFRFAKGPSRRLKEQLVFWPAGLP